MVDSNKIIIIFLSIIIILTLLSIEPFHTGHVLMPRPLALEEAIVIIFVSLVIIAYLIIRKRMFLKYPN